MPKSSPPPRLTSDGKLPKTGWHREWTWTPPSVTDATDETQTDCSLCTEVLCQGSKYRIFKSDPKAPPQYVHSTCLTEKWQSEDIASRAHRVPDTNDINSELVSQARQRLEYLIGKGDSLYNGPFTYQKNLAMSRTAEVEEDVCFRCGFAFEPTEEYLSWKFPIRAGRQLRANTHTMTKTRTNCKIAAKPYFGRPVHQITKTSKVDLTSASSQLSGKEWAAKEAEEVERRAEEEWASRHHPESAKGLAGDKEEDLGNWDDPSDVEGESL